MRKIVFLVLAATLLTGCATVLDRATEPIAFDSDPTAASLRVTCAHRPPQEAVTPAVIHVERRARDCAVEISKGGYAPASVTLEQGMNNRIFWNLLPMGLGIAYALTVDDNLGGLAAVLFGMAGSGGGFLVDWGTRRNADHDPKKVMVKLQPAAAPSPPRE